MDSFWEGLLVAIVAFVALAFGCLIWITADAGMNKKELIQQLYSECIEQGEYDKFQCYSMIYGDK